MQRRALKLTKLTGIVSGIKGFVQNIGVICKVPIVKQSPFSYSVVVKLCYTRPKYFKPDKTSDLNLIFLFLILAKYLRVGFLKPWIYLRAISGPVISAHFRTISRNEIPIENSEDH